MNAVRLHQRGGPEQLVYEDAPRPIPGPGDALVRVHACAITRDELTWGTTYTDPQGRERLPTIPGHEIAGVVEALAGDVTEPAVGSAVYGLTDFRRDGGAAELMLVRAADLAPRPASLSSVEAAAVPLAALTAWQALFDHAQLARGQRVLIHAAAGGVGTYAVQLAHWRGALVIGTARVANAPFLRGLGADEVVDYSVDRFEERVHGVDVVLDAVGGDTLARSWGVVRKGGTLVTIADSAPADTAARYGVRGVDFIVEPNRRQLIDIARLIDAGTLRPVVAETFPLREARRAFERSAPGHNRGKVVLEVSDAATGR
ncbi:MAG TPA: NADP-dependent oxidoreductase [Gemmatimonadales bacterium]|nr:NADP-dependent oxidoreductase [Gemmatimonadales bacterium]